MALKRSGSQAKPAAPAEKPAAEKPVEKPAEKPVPETKPAAGAEKPEVTSQGAAEVKVTPNPAPDLSTKEEVLADNAGTETQGPEISDADRARAEQELLDAQAEVALNATNQASGPTQTLVLVRNLRTSNFRQPSTEKWIQGKGTAYLLDDGWLRNQINADLLELAEEE